MRSPSDDATEASRTNHSKAGLASRRTLWTAAAGVVFSPPQRTGHARSFTGSDEPPPAAAVRQPPAFPTSLTETRARAEWAHFKARFIQADGRITDNGNGGISHSEGQGLAMLFAVHFDEPEIFTRTLRWTRAILGRTEDHLLAWCHRPDDPGRPGDRNNATDGDLLTAWALAEAANRWGHALHRGLGLAMARDIMGKTVIDGGNGPVLLPGAFGFCRPDSIVVNPSYYIYPAFKALSRLLPTPQWGALEGGGLRLARVARFGRWGLVPDWVSLPRAGGHAAIAQDRPARFSYDAVRVPLYLVWAGKGEEPVVSAAARFWHDPSLPRIPAWADLLTDETSPYAADPGIAAVAQVSAMGSQPGFMPRQINTPVLSATYYAAALRLMAVLAVRAMPTTARTDAALTSTWH